MNAALAPTPPETRLPPAKRKVRIATASLAGCFGCHMSFADIDLRLLQLAQWVEFDRSPLTDLKTVHPCDIALIEGGVCNAENVEVLRAFRRAATILVAVGACAINGGLPAQRNSHDVAKLLTHVFERDRNLAHGSHVPNDPELPLLLAHVHPIHEIVRVDYFLPGCPPTAEVIWKALTELLAGELPSLPYPIIRYD
jgi:NAD-reducing hydrogenase small subunit